MKSDFTVDQIMEGACEETGLSDFGATDFVAPLKNFLDFAKDAPFTEIGIRTQIEAIHRYLVNRLRAARDMAKHPEILKENVSDPIIVLGFPRSGTTVLQRMLSADPKMQKLALWRVLNPAPLPGEGVGDFTKRMTVAKETENAIRQSKPDLFAAHPMIADEAEEDWFLHHHDFQHVGNIWGGMVTKEYLAYLRSIPRLPSYEYVADLLRYLQWQDGGRRGRRWVLKSPIHIGCLDEILQVHPKAVFIYPKRDFQTVMASFCHALESSIAGVIDISPAKIGELAMDFWVDEMTRFFEARQRLGDKLQLMEINYQELLSNPIHHIRRLYDLADTSLSAESEQAILRWIGENPAGKHGKNIYSLEKYNLTSEQVDAEFSTFK